MQTSNTLAIMQSVATLSLMLSLSFAYLINPLEDSLFFSALDGFSSSLYNSNVINELNTFLEGEAQAEGEFWPGLVDDRMEGDEDWLRTIDQNEERLAAPENWNDTPGEIQRTIDSFVTELELIDREAVEDRSDLKIADELELNLPS